MPARGPGRRLVHRLLFGVVRVVLVVLVVSSPEVGAAVGFGLEARADGRVVSFAPASGLPPLPVADGARVAESPDGSRWLVPGRDGRAWLVADSLDGPGARSLDVEGVVTQAAFSPTGTRAVLVVRPSGWSRNAAANASDRRRFEQMHRARLVLVRLGEGLQATLEPESLAASASTDWNPVWLDDHRVLFQSLRTGLAAFFLVDVDTGATTQLSNLSVFRGRRGHRSALPVARTGEIERAAPGVALFTTAQEAGQDEVWQLALRDGYAPELGFVARGTLGKRAADGRFEVVLDGRVVADVRADGVVERRPR